MNRVIPTCFFFVVFVMLSGSLSKADESKNGIFDDVKKLLQDRSIGNPYDQQRVASIDVTSNNNNSGSGGGFACACQ